MILFLDFDGVLHPDAVFRRGGRPTLVHRDPDARLFMWAEHLTDSLMLFPDLRIVLSTSWARWLGFDRARDALTPALRARVIGSTWHSGMARVEGYSRAQTWWDSVTRYQQIRRYVDRGGVSDWLAVDDDGHGWSTAERRRLVLTDRERGLGEQATRDELLEKLAS